ncbi:O-methyltransferase sol2 [Paramyrothecium foliicola]|nr:O-methyltransferase sol2 [Paramyrothecium foliicola]
MQWRRSLQPLRQASHIIQDDSIAKEAQVYNEIINRGGGFRTTGLDIRLPPVPGNDGDKKPGSLVAQFPKEEAAKFNPRGPPRAPMKGTAAISILNIPQSQMCKILMDEAISTGHIKVLFSNEISSIENYGTGGGAKKVSITVRDHASHADRQYTASFLVGADGNGPITTTLLMDPLHYTILSPLTPPVRGQVSQWRVTFALNPEDVRTKTDQEFLKEEHIAQHYDRVWVGSRPVSYKIDRRATYTVHQRLAANLKKGRCLLAGDAAHINNVIGGLGLSNSLLDSVALSEALVMILREGKPVNPLLTMYSDERRQVFQFFIDPVSTWTEEIVAYLEANKIAEPNFSADSSSTPMTPEYVALQNKLTGSLEDLRFLVEGPTQLLRSVCVLGFELAAFQIALDFEFFNSVEPGKEISVAELAQKAVFQQTKPGWITHTSASQIMHQDMEIRSAVHFCNDEMLKAAADSNLSLKETPYESNLEHCPFQTRHGDSIFKYYAKHPDHAARFARAMAGITRMGREVHQLRDCFPWKNIDSGTVVDIGGGSGHVSIGLARLFPKLKFIVQDDSADMLAEGEKLLTDDIRCNISFEQHNFFKPQPSRNAVAFILRQCTHDWCDRDVVLMLKSVVSGLEASPPDTPLLINDIMMPEPGIWPRHTERALRDLDMIMLVGFGSKERNKEEFDVLLKQADPSTDITRSIVGSEASKGTKKQWPSTRRELPINGFLFRVEAGKSKLGAYGFFPPLVIDRLLRRLVTEIPDNVLISYPSRTPDYEDFTASDVDKLTRAIASVLPQYLKTPMSDTSPGERLVVAIVGVSNLEYHLYFLALQSLGWRTLLMSPRLADQGFAHLIQQTACKTVLVSGIAAGAIARLKRAKGGELDIIPMLNVRELTDIVNQGSVDDHPPSPEPKSPLDSPQLIIHSSGTTGLPKPVTLISGEWLLQNAAMAERTAPGDTLTTLPVFHSFGIGLLLRMLASGRKLSIVSAERPVTASDLLKALELTKSTTLVTVPLVLKFCAEAEGGPSRLAQLNSVITAGSAVPQQLGDELVQKGVAVSTIYGQTESGGLMAPGTGTNWCWVSPLPHAEPFMKFEPVQGEDNIYQLVILQGLPTKVLSNRSDGSYHTNDLFERHPSDPRRWKFAGRADDVIVLMNGEKANPTPLEEALSANANVQAAVVFGAGHDSPGALVIPSDKAAGLSKTQLLESIEPHLNLGNSKVPAYARISLDSVIFKKIEVSLPMTAKSTLIRSRFLESCRGDIERFYDRREKDNYIQIPVTDQNVHGLVREIVCSILPIDKNSLADDADFFLMGMDSLQASHVRARLLRRIDLGYHSLLANVAFEHATVNRLSQHIMDVRNGWLPSCNPETLKLYAEGLVQKYTQFPKLKSGSVIATSGQVVLLTGATGTIGCRILHHLAHQPGIDRIYCLVRAETDGSAAQRVIKAISNARLDDMDGDQWSRIVHVAATLGEPRLGLSNELYEVLRTTVTTIIHGSWAVNFNMSLKSFENPHIASVSHLLNLAMQSPSTLKPTFSLLSSVASSLRGKDCPMKEVQYEWEAASMGYGQSKWVAEKICHAAARHAQICGVEMAVKILRIGQVAGDTRYGIWNPSETIPIIVQSAITTGVLPIMEGPLDTHYWLPVDIAATSIVELVLAKPTSTCETSPAYVFHVANAAPVLWTSEVLPALRKQGMRFEAVPASDWIQRLENLSSEVEDNPALHLLEWLKRRYNEPKLDSEDGAEKREMDLTISKQFSSTLKNGVKISDQLIGKFLTYWIQLEGWKSLKRND